METYTCLVCRTPLTRTVVWVRGYPFCSERCADDHRAYVASYGGG